MNWEGRRAKKEEKWCRCHGDWGNQISQTRSQGENAALVGSSCMLCFITVNEVVFRGLQAGFHWLRSQLTLPTTGKEHGRVFLRAVMLANILTLNAAPKHQTGVSIIKQLSNTILARIFLGSQCSWVQQNTFLALTRNTSAVLSSSAQHPSKTKSQLALVSSAPRKLWAKERRL